MGRVEWRALVREMEYMLRPECEIPPEGELERSKATMSEQEHLNMVHANDEAFKAYDKEGASGNDSAAPVLATSHICSKTRKETIMQEI
jgi:hypothetical protein